MKVLAAISTIAIQFFGNVMKLLFHADFALRPDKRYTIPAKSPPMWRSSRAKRIPRIFWQTGKTAEVTLPVYANYLFNRLMTPTFEHRFYDDEACDAFVGKNYPGEVSDSYRLLQIGAAKADLWRVLVILKEGGIYLDLDAAFSWPPELFLGKDQAELFVLDRNGSLTNFCFAAEPGNEVFADIRDRIVKNIRANTLRSVYDMTGPTVVDDIAGAAGVVIEHCKTICRQGQFTQKRFQYPDYEGHWAREQEQKPIVRESAEV
jgi:mannosyltransferase OCH1-like enzyme